MLSSRSVVLACGGGLFALLLFYSARATYADWLSRQPGDGALLRATQIEPGNARLQSRLAAETGNGEALQRAVAANPNDARLLIEAALREETNGAPDRAERLLLEAARRDATYEPRWSLANFYYRMGKWDRFWHWSREAARINYGELRGLYRLCLRADEDGARVLARVVPERPDETRQYLEVLLNDRRTSGVEEAAARLFGWRRKIDLGPAVVSAQFLLGAARTESAVRTWNAAVGAGILDRERVDPEQGKLIGNPRFRMPVSGGPFDWRIPFVEGVSAQSVSDGIRFEFSGSQPPDSFALEQALAVSGGRLYSVRTRARVRLAPGRSGFRWRVVDRPTGAPLAPPSEPIGDPGGHEYRFRAPEGAGVVYLQLAAAREPGFRRPEGILELREVAFTLVP